MKLTAKQISKSFHRIVGEANYFNAVETTNLEFEEGKLIVIIGKSGSGKSTLLNMLSGLLEPSEGEVLIDDNNLYELDDNKRSKFRNENFGIIPQGQTGLKNLTILENVLLPSLLYSKDNYEEKALKLFEKFGITALKDSYPSELSGGELRRMAIARAIIMDPKIIFADEPTGDLDEENTTIVLDILKELSRNGKTIIMVTHDDDAIKYADILYKMNKGVIEEIKQ